MKTELVRVGIVHNHGGSLLSRAVQAALFSHSSVSVSLLSFLQGVLSLPESVELQDIMDVANNSSLDAEKLVQLLFSACVNTSLAEHALFGSTVLNLKPGQNALLSNGKVGLTNNITISNQVFFGCQLVGPLLEGEEFNEADWSMLYSMESETYAAKLAAVVGDLNIKELSPDEDTSSYRSDLVMRLASLLRSQSKKTRLSQMPSLSGHLRCLRLSCV